MLDATCTLNLGGDILLVCAVGRIAGKGTTSQTRETLLVSPTSSNYCVWGRAEAFPHTTADRS